MAEKNDSAFILDPEKLSRIQRENPFVRISDAVYDILEEAILSSQYDPGAKLKINTIAEQLGVSGTPVREAIDRLILRGLVVEQVVDGKKYKSYRVFDMDDQDIAQLFIARKAIDGIAANGKIDWQALRSPLLLILVCAAAFILFGVQLRGGRRDASAQPP